MIKSSLPPSKKTSQRWRMERRKKQRWKVDIIDVPYPETPAAQTGCLLSFLCLSLVLFLLLLFHHLFFCHLSLSPVFTLLLYSVFSHRFQLPSVFLTFHTLSVTLWPLLWLFLSSESLTTEPDLLSDAETSLFCCHFQPPTLWPAEC